MSEGSNTSLLYPIVVLCRVKRHLNPVMDAELLVQRIANKISPEPIRRQARRRLLQPLIRNASVFKGNGGLLWVALSRGAQQTPRFFIAFKVKELSAQNECV